MTARLRFALAAVTITLCMAPAASANDPDGHKGGAVVAPADARWVGEVWAQLYALPVSEDDRTLCLEVGHKVVQEIGGPCTIELGTTFTLGFGTAWSTAEAPFPQTRAEQLAQAIAWDRANVASMTVSVDGGRLVQIRRPRFELFSPQRTVRLPEDNLLDVPDAGIDVPAQTVTLSAHAWAAAVRGLSLGRHDVVGDVRFADGERAVVPHLLDVVAKRGHGG